jgi:hypothetical protein
MPVEMQKWEYRNHWVYRVEREVPAGERGIFGREKPATELPWLITIGKEGLPLYEGLASLGEEEWEMAGTVQAMAYFELTDTPQPSQWVSLPHWLYFKRRKP